MDRKKQNYYWILKKIQQLIYIPLRYHTQSAWINSVLIKVTLSRQRHCRRVIKDVYFTERCDSDLKISNCQRGIVHEGCWVIIQTRVGHLEASTVCWRESARRVHCPATRPHSSRSNENIEKVEDLMLSEKDKSKRTAHCVRFCMKLTFPVQVCILHKTFHRDAA